MDREKIHKRRWWTLGVLSLSLVVIGLDNTILNVALPTLVRDLQATQSDLQWMIDAYILVFAGLLLTMGSVGDRFGRKRVLTIGLVIFGIASLGSSFADSAEQLIAGRAVMGIGAAMIMPSTLSIITSIFSGKELGKAIGIWAGVAGIGIVGGPPLGGWLLENFWWGSVFIVNVPIVLVAILLGSFLVPESKDPAATPLDIVGAGLSIASLVALVYGIIEAPQHGWTADETLIALGIGGVLLIAFIVWELRSPHPMLQMSFFRSRRFSAANFAITLTFFALFGSVFLMTQHLQFVLGFTPLEAGIRIIPVATMIIAAPLSAKLTEKLGTKIVVFTGLVVVAAAFLQFSTIDTTGYQVVAIGLGMLGFGMGLVMAPATESVMGSVPLAKAGVGSAMNDTTREVGGALGVAVLGSVFSSQYHTEIAAAVRGLPANLAAAASDSVGAATAIASQIGGAAGSALAQASKIAFVDSLSSTLLVAAGVAAVGALGVLLFLPSRNEAVAGTAHGVPAGAPPQPELQPVAVPAAAPARAMSAQAPAPLALAPSEPEPAPWTVFAPSARNGQADGELRVALERLPFQAGAGSVKGTLEDLGHSILAYFKQVPDDQELTIDYRELAGYLMLEQRFERVNAGIDPQFAAAMFVGGIAAQAETLNGDNAAFLRQAVDILLDGIGPKDVSMNGAASLVRRS